MVRVELTLKGYEIGDMNKEPIGDTIWVNLLGAETRYYEADSIRTRCIRAGQGRAVILLHGGGGHAEAYSRNVLPLSEKFEVFAVDFLGHGLTDGLDRVPSKEDYVKHLVGFMDSAGIEKAHLVGESLGGWLAFWTALLEPTRVGKLVSVCGARLAVTSDDESARKTAEGRKDLAERTRRFLDEPTLENVRARLAWLFYNPERDLTDELVELRWRMYQRESVRKTLQSMSDRSSQRQDEMFTPEVLSQLGHETLMLWTSHNPSATVEVAKRAAEFIPRAEFVVMDDCGHWPQWEDPSTFNSIVSEYLER
jgi:pimeloyl-ACP methyl ester carboxylesterase